MAGSTAVRHDDAAVAAADDVVVVGFMDDVSADDDDESAVWECADALSFGRRRKLNMCMIMMCDLVLCVKSVLALSIPCERRCNQYSCMDG